MEVCDWLRIRLSFSNWRADKNRSGAMRYKSLIHSLESPWEHCDDNWQKGEKRKKKK